MEFGITGVVVTSDTLSHSQRLVGLAEEAGAGEEQPGFPKPEGTRILGFEALGSSSASAECCKR